jgi:hypothetical protein
VYEEGQAGPSNTACATYEGEPELAGDLNGDGQLNILDIVALATLVINMDYDETGDFNDDGILNILDIISLVNLVLGRTIHTEDCIGTKTIIYEDVTSASISADGSIAGIQMTIKTSRLQLNEDLPMTVETNYVEDYYIILIYGLNGETMSGDNIRLFTASEDYEITSLIVANVLPVNSISIASLRTLATMREVIS